MRNKIVQFLSWLIMRIRPVQPAAPAQPEYSISVQLADYDKAVPPTVTVHTEGYLCASVVNSQGEFTFGGLRDATYVITPQPMARCIWNPASATVTLTPSNPHCVFLSSDPNVRSNPWLGVQAAPRWNTR